MSEYIPLAIKYRPQRFLDVVGQDIIIKIITRGLQKNRLGSAMLFSGTRGVGKTTIARILAKSFRCPNADPEPCCLCESCIDFSRGNQMDIIEIDAASNTGVDDVREIIESCRYKPTSGKYKIFIIDEVHMLSKSAFNALLKTLEEPPEHVKFMLATTETYKIPETILSRVLKFDLKRVDQQLISQYLSSICNQENIKASSEAVFLIAKAANGSIRDGLSILEQAINMASGNEISASDIKEMLNISDDSDLIDLLNLIISSDTKAAIMKYREVTSGDFLAEKISNSLMDYVYVLICIKSNVQPLDSLISYDLMPKLRNISEKVSMAALSRIWQMLLKGIEELKICDHPEIVLEMIIVRITYASGLPDLQEIINGIDKNCSEKKHDNDIVNRNLIDKMHSTSDDTSRTDLSSNSLLDEAMKMFPNAKLQ